MSFTPAFCSNLTSLPLATHLIKFVVGSSDGCCFKRPATEPCPCWAKTHRAFLQIFPSRHNNLFLERWVLKMFLRDHSAEDARVAARSLDLTTQNNGVLFNALRKFPLAVQYFLVHFVSLPSTVTLDHNKLSLRPRGKKTIETSALRAVPRLHEHPE